MKILAKFLTIFLLLSVIGGGVFYYFFAESSSSLAAYLRANAAHLKNKKIKLNGDYLYYYEGVNDLNKDTIVLLHGLADSKKGFLKLSKYLSDDYYLIIPDLPGQGENKKNSDFNYSFENQALIISKFLNRLNLKKYHLVGVSTGGVVSLEIGLIKSNQVKSIILVNTPYLSYKNQKFLNIFSKKVKNSSDLYDILDIAFYQKPNFSKPIRDMLVKRLDSEFKFVNNTIISKMNVNHLDSLEEALSVIKIPTLILHSKYDSLISVEDAFSYDKRLSNSAYGTIDDTAHYPQYEMPMNLASAITNQIKTN